jgi:hypothetical protein
LVMGARAARHPQARRPSGHPDRPSPGARDLGESSSSSSGRRVPNRLPGRSRPS